MFGNLKDKLGHPFKKLFVCCVEVCSDWFEKTMVIYGPRQATLVLTANASSEGSGEPAHPRSLARTFAACSYKQ